MDPVENYRPTMPEAVVRDWAQDAQKELVSLRARIDDLSRAYAVQGLAIEELTAERDEARARVAELEAELKSIADAKYTAWDDGYNTPQDFVAWVQNRCRYLLKR